MTIRPARTPGPPTVIESQPDREVSVPRAAHTGLMTTRQNDTAFSVRIHDDAEPAVIEVAGELDSFSACELRAGIAEVLGRHPGTILDIRDVPFVDSAGLGAIVGGIRRLRETGVSVALCCTSSSVLLLLRVTGLDRIVPIAGSLAEARQIIADAQGGQELFAV